ncbi:mevalonate kinase [Enterococcus sp. 8G7_MSG3316]|uniref:Mevalonate kinase n=1 Tax=Candidatus Enterococcus testudinis TaxID=1834191 RepID=A0A242A9A6_9ENTE|nr:mevalonate kinase [Enterococcus sp. 8G7_MSG3316]OTN77618.1 mevalonate kinase [Enterococcus sp. 8G7_MSG3316]
MSIGSGIATGKIILMGEHAVVYGEPAIAFPFAGAKVQVEIAESTANTLISSYFHGLLQDVPVHMENVKELLLRLQQDFQTGPFQTTIVSTIPSERGMGSSAAVAVALTRAFFDWIHHAYQKEELMQYVDFSEKIAHGNPSGIDAAAASGHDAIYFVKGQAITSFPLTIDGYLVVADTGIKGQTREAVKSVAQLFDTNSSLAHQAIQQLGQETNRAKQAIINNQLVALGQAMNQAHQALQSLGVSNTRLDHLVATARQHGAFGAKLTGGGRGGCLIVLTDTKEAAETISHILLSEGARATWMQGLGVYEHV